VVSPKPEPRRYIGLSTSASLLILVGILIARAHVGGAEPASTDSLPAHAAVKGILNGVFSEEQRRRGLQVYLKQCSSCHGERLRGGESAPALTGANFREHWIGRTLDDLMQKIALMPPKDPGRITPEEAASVIAVILAANAYPPGDEDLPATSNVLQQIPIEPLKSL